MHATSPNGAPQLGLPRAYHNPSHLHGCQRAVLAPGLPTPPPPPTPQAGSLLVLGPRLPDGLPLQSSPLQSGANQTSAQDGYWVELESLTIGGGEAVEVCRRHRGFAEAPHCCPCCLSGCTCWLLPRHRRCCRRAALPLPPSCQQPPAGQAVGRQPCCNTCRDRLETPPCALRIRRRTPLAPQVAGTLALLDSGTPTLELPDAAWSAYTRAVEAAVAADPGLKLESVRRARVAYSGCCHGAWLARGCATLLVGCCRCLLALRMLQHKRQAAQALCAPRPPPPGGKLTSCVAAPPTCCVPACSPTRLPCLRAPRRPPCLPSLTSQSPCWAMPRVSTVRECAGATGGGRPPAHASIHPHACKATATFKWLTAHFRLQ